MKLVLLQPTLRAYETGGNQETIRAIASKVAGRCTQEDILLLPEHFSFDDSAAEYDKFILALSREIGCVVVGGSHHRRLDGSRLNYGAVAGPDGSILATYTKVRPYFNEQANVRAGDRLGEFIHAGRNILVMICADFWYSDLFQRVANLPDLILVPSLSVSRKPTAAYSRSLWLHLAISRAYEFGSFVGISDWGEASILPKYRTCGVGGFADPTQLEPHDFYRPIAGDGISVYEPDFGKLDAFREDRRMRGFFWK